MNKKKADEHFIYPLAALVGQEEMLTALLLLAVDFTIGGLLLLGEKGTAKSTAARGFCEILPPLSGTAKKPPFRNIPLGVSEDRLLGGLDWEKTMAGGQPQLSLGLLGEAHQGLIYIDEINLLDPSLAHLILEALSFGRINLERDGFSISYPAQVALLASMNPEEGSLGPQIADRLTLQVTLIGEQDPARRAEIVRRRLAFEKDPQAFRTLYQGQTIFWQNKIAAARRLYQKLAISPQLELLAAQMSAQNQSQGHRAELALVKAACSLAALDGASIVTPDHLHKVIPYILPQRQRVVRSTPKTLIVLEKQEGRLEKKELFEPLYIPQQMEIPPDFKEDSEVDESVCHLKIFKAAAAFKAVTPQTKREIGPRQRSGRRSARETTKARGRAFRTTARRLGRPLSLAATLRAAAPFQVLRSDEEGQGRLKLKISDFREKVYRQKTGRLVVFVVDSSGSIGTLYRMEEAKAAILSLLSESYQKRDRVALIAFYGAKAELLLPPTNSPDLAARLLAELPSGGKTPMAAAFVMLHKMLKVERAKDPQLQPFVVLMTDGRPNIPLSPGKNPWKEALELARIMAADPTMRFLLIDTDRGAYNELKLIHDLALALRAPRLKLEELREGKLWQWLK